MLTVAHYCVLTSLSWPCKHHSALILSLLFYQACLEEGKFFVCDQITPIPDGKLLLNYIRNVSFTSRFRGPMTIKSINTKAKFALSLRTASCQVAACGIMSLTLSYQISISLQNMAQSKAKAVKSFKNKCDQILNAPNFVNTFICLNFWPDIRDFPSRITYSWRFRELLFSVLF